MATLLLILVSLLKLFGLFLLLVLLTSPITIPLLFLGMKIFGKGHIVKSWIVKWNSSYGKTTGYKSNFRDDNQMIKPLAYTNNFTTVNPATGLFMNGTTDSAGNSFGSSSNSDYHNNHNNY